MSFHLHNQNPSISLPLDRSKRVEALLGEGKKRSPTFIPSSPPFIPSSPPIISLDDPSLIIDEEASTWGRGRSFKEEGEGEDWRFRGVGNLSKGKDLNSNPAEVIYIDDEDDPISSFEESLFPSVIPKQVEDPELAKLPVKERVPHYLKKIFGHSSFRNYQEKAIMKVLEKRDVLLILATGGGKSLCFQLPPVVEGKMAIIISPLIALMQNQLHYCRNVLNIQAELMSSETGKKDRARIENSVCRVNSSVRLLYLTPEFIGFFFFFLPPPFSPSFPYPSFPPPYLQFPKRYNQLPKSPQTSSQQQHHLSFCH